MLHKILNYICLKLEITGIEPISYECKSYILPFKLYLHRLEMESNQFKEICSFSH